MIHNVNVEDNAYNVAPFNNVTGSAGCGLTSLAPCARTSRPKSLGRRLRNLDRVTPRL